MEEKFFCWEKTFFFSAAHRPLQAGPRTRHMSHPVIGRMRQGGYGGWRRRGRAAVGQRHRRGTTGHPPLELLGGEAEDVVLLAKVIALRGGGGEGARHARHTACVMEMLVMLRALRRTTSMLVLLHVSRVDRRLGVRRSASPELVTLTSAVSPVPSTGEPP